MKDKAPLIVMIIVAAGLGFGLIVVNDKAHREKQDLTDALSVQSNTVTSIKASLSEQQAVNQVLETNLASTRADLSNKLALSDANLRTSEENLEKARQEAAANAAAIANRDKQIADLENHNQDLDRQSADMREHIGNLQSLITATQDKLARSDGDRTVLLKELKRLQTEKVAWENRFNDLAVLQAQVHKLKTELAEARNLEWIRQGVYASLKEKGGERLISPPSYRTVGADTSLQVEMHQNGQAPMVTPLPGGPQSR